MDSWLVVLAELVVGVAILSAPLGLLAARRRWLSRPGGTFECSVRLGSSEAGSGWVMGVARYHDGLLEWFRSFSYAYRPRLRFRRRDLHVLHSRPPDAAEAASLYAGQQVVTVQVGRAGSNRHDQWELAMSGDSLTGLLSWLEAAPPGVGSYGVPTL